MSGRPLVTTLALLGLLAGSAVAVHPEARAGEGPKRLAIEIGDAPVFGAADAPVTIVAFADFTCRECARGSRETTRLMAAHRGRIRLVFKHFPDRSEPGAFLAHCAAAAAAEQGKFWPMQRLLFAYQPRFSRAELIEYAETLELDMPTFVEALDSERIRTRVLADVAQGRRLRVGVAPAYFVNGRMVPTPPHIAGLSPMVEGELQAAGPRGPTR